MMPMETNLSAWLLELERNDIELSEEVFLQLVNLSSYAEDKDSNPALTPLLKYIVYLMNTYMIPVVIAVGLIGNLTSFAVFMGSYLRRYSSNIYLAALAWSDNVFLCCLLLEWLSTTGVDIYSRDGWCQLFVYLTYVTSFLSVWYVVAFSIERYIAVCYPLRRQQLCTTSKAKWAVSGCAVLSFLLHMYSLFVYSPGSYNGETRCIPNPNYFKLVSAFNYIDALTAFIIPAIIIIFCNVRIFYTIVLFYRERMAVLSSSRTKVARSGPHHLGRAQPWTRQQMSRNIHQRLAAMEGQVKVTKMLLVVSTVFLVLNLPAYSVRLHIMIQLLIDQHHTLSVNTQALHIVFQFIYYINFSVNFFLYNLSGKTFRKGLRRLATSCKLRMKSLVNWRFDSFEDIFLSRQAMRTFRTELPLEERPASTGSCHKPQTDGSFDTSSKKRLFETSQ